MSKDLNEAFRRHLVKSGEGLDIDFSIQVLSSGSWPFQQSSSFSLPTEVILPDMKFLVYLVCYVSVLAVRYHIKIIHDIPQTVGRSDM